MVLLEAVMVKVEAEAEVEEAEEVEAEEAEGVEETGVGGEAVLLEAATVAAEVAQWAEAVPPVAVPVDVVGATSVSGGRTSEQFTLLSSRQKRTR